MTNDPFLTAMCPNYLTIAGASTSAANDGDQVKAYALHRQAEAYWNAIDRVLDEARCNSRADADRIVAEESLTFHRLIALIRREPQRSTGDQHGVGRA